MPFADTSERNVTQVASTYNVTLAAACEAGDLLGYSTGWILADANAGPVPAQVVAINSGKIGDIVAVARECFVEGFTGGTIGAAVYLSDTGGHYASSASATTPQVVGEMATATGAWVRCALTGTVTNTDVASGAAIAYNKLASLATGHILAGNAGTPTDTTISGDVGIGATGAVTITPGIIDNADINASAAIAVTKLAGLATGHIIAGNAGSTADTTISGDITLGATGIVGITPDSIVNADINTAAAIAVTKLAGLATGHIIAGNAGATADTTISGDITLGATGVVGITPDSIVNADINTAAAIAVTKLAGLATGHIIAGNAGVTSDTTISGDIGIGATGIVAITADSIVNADVNTAAAIVGSKLATNARRHYARSNSWDLDVVGAADLDTIIMMPSDGITIVKAQIVYEVETSGNAVAGSMQLGTASAGVQICAAVNFGNAVGAGTAVNMPITSGVVAAGGAIWCRLHGVAAACAGWVHCEIEFTTDD